MTAVGEPKAFVRNASDREQVKQAKETEKQKQRREQNDIRDLMASPSGRRVAWRILEKTRVYESIMETNARIYYNAGQQDLGHWFMAELASADPANYLLMQQEAAQMDKNATEPKPRSEESIEDV